MNTNTVLLEVQDGAAIIRLNRPEALNALDMEMRGELADIIEKVSTDQSVKVIVITGQGRAFCSGGDVKSQKERQGWSLAKNRMTLKELQSRILKLANIEKPVIAAVNGPAFGAGFSLALAADMCIASDRAKFCMVFSKVGLVPDVGGIYFLTRNIGLFRAKELVYTAKVLDAQEAYTMGIVNKVVPHDDLEQETMLLAKQLTSGATLSFALCKALFNKAATVDLQTYLEMEAFAQTIAQQSKDHKEGVQAFLDKRKAVYMGE